METKPVFLCLFVTAVVGVFLLPRAEARRRYTYRHEFRTTNEWVYNWGNGVTNVFTGDFNGDGKWDIGVTGRRDEGDRCWYIRYGDGRGNFGGPGREPRYCWQNGVTNAFTGDFNGDGIWDIGVTGTREERDGKWYIRYGDGRGNFGGPGREPVYSWGNTITNIFTGDFNGDGKWDIGVTGRRDENYRKWHIRYGDGKGGFGRETVFSWGNGVTNVFTGDFNGDGKWDIGVTGTREEGERRWYIRLGNGNGYFGGPGREPVYSWGNGVTNIFTGDFDGNGGWDIGVTGTREQGYRKWHIRLNARGGILKTLAPPRVTRIGYPDRVMNGELVRVTVQAESHATRVGLTAVGRGIGTLAGRYWEMTRLGNIWVADVVASSSQSYVANAFVGDRAGPVQRFSFNVVRDFAPLNDPAYAGFPGLLQTKAGPVPPNFNRWDPAPARAHSSAYYRTFGEGAEGGVATTPSKCCRFAVKFEGRDVPVRNARIEIFKRAGPLATKWGGRGNRYTDDSGFYDLTPLFKEWAPGYSVDLYTEYPALTLVNGKKLGATFKQTIDNLSAKDGLRYIRDEKNAKDEDQKNEKEAFAYGNRLMAAHEVMKRVLGDEWTSATGSGKIKANWEHALPVTSTGFPFPWGAEVILKKTSRDEVTFPAHGLTADTVIREELAHAVHFQAVGRSAELFGRYAMFIVESLSRPTVLSLVQKMADVLRVPFNGNSEAIRFPHTAPGNEKIPSAAATRVGSRAAYPQTRNWTDLGLSTGGLHNYNIVSTEVTAYVEAFGIVAANGVFEDATQGSVLEAVRAKLVEEECKSGNGCNAADIAPEVGKIDTLMSAEKVIKNEGHLAILMFLDFPRLAGISVGRVFGMMKRSTAISFREFARYVKSSELRYFGALAQAAARQNIVLERLVDRMGSN